MQKWEYLTVSAHEHDWVDSRGRSGKFKNLKSVGLLSAWKAWDYVPLLNELGAEGWELIDSFGAFTFKRPIPSLN